MTTGAELGNLLLAALPSPDWQRLRPLCRKVPLRPGDRLIEAAKPYRLIFFPTSGVISATFTYKSGAVAELATTGREGMAGLGPVFGGERALADHVVHVPGEALALARDDYRACLEDRPALRRISLAYAHAFFAQTLYARGCAQVHGIRERAAVALLMCHDRCDGDRFALTQDSLATMLGASRETVNAVARALQGEGRIRYRYGAVSVEDRAGLERASCECYGLMRRAYESALSPWLG